MNDNVLLHVAKTPKGIKKKLLFKWEGPFKVAEKKSALLYKLAIADERVVALPPKNLVHISRLRKLRTIGDYPRLHHEIDLYQDLSQARDDPLSAVGEQDIPQEESGSEDNIARSDVSRA